jgi:DNA-binding response OmpR family regulator
MHLLVLEDNARLAALIAETLASVGWSADIAPTLHDAQETIEARRHDVLLIDLGLPDGDGRSLIKTIRDRKDNVPILVLSARTLVEDHVDALDCGADDYLNKPFQNEELVARCRSLMRRKRVNHHVALSAGNLRFEPAGMTFSVDGRLFDVGAYGQIILATLLEDCGRVVPRQRLLGTLSSYRSEPTTAALDKEVSRLRARLAAAGATCSIETIRGIGFMIRAKRP